MWRDWQRKARFQLTSYLYTSELHQKLFILLCPFFAFLKKSMPIFQRSRCKDTHFIFGTVRICPQMSANVRKCPLFFSFTIVYVKKNQYLCGVNSITLLYLSNFSNPQTKQPYVASSTIQQICISYSLFPYCKCRHCSTAPSSLDCRQPRTEDSTRRDWL